MTKYDWSNVDKNIKWIAKDCDGAFFGFDFKPILNVFGFSRVKGFKRRLFISQVSVAWQDSLEERPNDL